MNFKTILAGTFALIVAAMSAQATGLEAVEKPAGISVTENGKEVLFYQRTTKALDGKRPRAHYIHPLYNLDGRVITEDFPADHLHHRGVFWAWHQILIGDKKVGDAWETKDFTYDVKDVKVSKLPKGVLRLTTTTHWKSPLWLDPAGKEKPYVDETAMIDIHQATANTRTIDFHIHIVALEDGLRIGGSDDEKGYSGFSPRFKFPRALQFTGERGKVEPKNSAVDAGPWVDFSGKFGDGDDVSGIAMLSHPSLPEYPSKWILRSAKSMQNAAYPGRTPVLIPKNKPLDLRYRLIIHRGDAQTAGIAGQQQQYAKEVSAFSASASQTNKPARKVF